VRFGDGSTQAFRRIPSNPFGLTTTHTYGPGQFDVVVIAHVTGQAYGAFFAPNGTPSEQLVPFAINISNTASGLGAPIVYVPPVVTVTGSPSGTLPDGTLIPADAVGHDPAVLAARPPLLALSPGGHRDRGIRSSRAAS
jgi:hypothetical protein